MKSQHEQVGTWKSNELFEGARNKAEKKNNQPKNKIPNTLAMKLIIKSI